MSASRFTLTELKNAETIATRTGRDICIEGGKIWLVKSGENSQKTQPALDNSSVTKLIREPVA